MRIISGKFKGRSITPPGNLRARPTTDFAKENLFNILNNTIDFEECEVLDLFSGTGSVSYEFISRGAKSVTSVEVNAVHHNFIKSVAKKLEMDNLYATRANAFLYIKGCKKQFDVIFADPPYDIEGSDKIPDMIFEGGLLADNGILILEHSKNMDFSSHPDYYDMRSYGSVHFAFFKKQQ